MRMNREGSGKMERLRKNEWMNEGIKLVVVKVLTVLIIDTVDIPR